MNRILSLAAGVAILLAHSPVAAQNPAPAVVDAASAKVLDALESAMGGRAAWEAMPSLRFDWVVERDGKEAMRAQHLWDRARGRYRVDWRTREGAEIRTAFDLATRTGKAMVNGVAAAPAAVDSLMKSGYGRFINDSYWLLMPWKLRDPGVRVEHAGAEAIDGRQYDVLHVSFASVGLTPGDHYWAWIDRDTHRMDRWAFFLEGMEGEPARDKARAWTWSDWRQSGGAWFAADRRDAAEGSTRRIHFPVLGVLASIDSRLFEALEMPMPEPVASDPAKHK